MGFFCSWVYIIQCFAKMKLQGFFQQFWEKAPGQNWEKMFKFHSDIDHCFSYLKKKRIFFFYFSKLGKTDMVLRKRRLFFLLRMGPKEGQKTPWISTFVICLYLRSLYSKECGHVLSDLGPGITSSLTCVHTDCIQVKNLVFQMKKCSRGHFTDNILCCAIHVQCISGSAVAQG